MSIPNCENIAVLFLSYLLTQNQLDRLKEEKSLIPSLMFFLSLCRSKVLTYSSLQRIRQEYWHHIPSVSVHMRRSLFLLHL